MNCVFFLFTSYDKHPLKSIHFFHLPCYCSREYPLNHFMGDGWKKYSKEITYNPDCWGTKKGFSQLIYNFFTTDVIHSHRL